MSSVRPFPPSGWAVFTDGQDVVGHVLLTFRIWHEDGAWQGACAELGVPSFGDDPGDALDNVLDATILYLDEIEAQGEREAIFAERGLVLGVGHPTDASDVRKESVGAGETVSRMELGLAACG